MTFVEKNKDLRNWNKHYFKRLFLSAVFLSAFGTAGAQTFTFECVGDFISGAECPECTGATSQRLFNGLMIKRGGSYFRNIDCPYIIRVQGQNLVFTELIPNAETVTISLLGTGYSTLQGFMDSTACMCARQDSSWIGGSGTGDPSSTNEGILGVDAGGANDADITSNTSGANGVTLSGSTTVIVTETPSANGGTITLQADTSLIATVNDIRANTFDTVTDYTALRLYDKPQKLVYVSQNNLEGFFERVASVPADDNGIYISGVYEWERVRDRSIVNVKWYGAVGDSTTDDYAAMQAALDAAKLQKRCVYYIPAGKYRITNTLECYRPIDISIRGAGMDNTWIYPVNVTGFFLHMDSLDFVSGGKYGVNDGRNMRMEDLGVFRVGSNSYTTPVNGIYMKGGFEFVLQNIRIEEFYASGGAAAGKSTGLRMAGQLVPASPEYAAEAVQHKFLKNVYISECDTGISVIRHNTLYFSDVRLDLNYKVGLSLMNNIIWDNGMVQGSGKAGIYIQNWVGNQYRGVYLKGIHFENNSWDGGYGAIYKPSTVPMTNFEVSHCLFSAANSDTVAYLRAVRDGFWGNNTNGLGSSDTLYIIDCGNFDFGQDNYYVFNQVTTGSKIRFLNGSPGVSDEAYNGLTINRGAAGSYALNVAGTGVFEGNVGIGIDAASGVPAQDLHVQGTARITGNSGTSATIMGRDGDGDVSAISPGTGVALASNTLTTEQGGEYFTRTLPTTVGNTVQLFTLQKTDGAQSYHLNLSASAVGVSVSKQYLINSFYDGSANTWRIMPPISSTGAYVGQDFVLEIKSHNQRDSLRVRRTAGTTAATLYCDLTYSARTSTTFTEQSAEQTPTAVTLLYPLSALAQSANKVGIGTVEPSRELDVNGEARVRDLTTTTATQLTGADANGVLSGVTLATGLTLPAGVLTPVDNSATNELQTLSNTSDATSHTVTLSSSGGSVQLIEGANITLTTGGTALNGTVTIASTASGGTNYQTWRDDGTPVTQQPNANFVSNSDIAFTLTNDGANSETEVTADIPANAVDNSELRQSAGLSVIGRSANSTGDVADITAASDGQVLRRSGTAIGFGQVNLGSANAITGTLPVGNGGTGATTFPANRILYGNGTSAINTAAELLYNGSDLRLGSASAGRRFVAWNDYSSTSAGASAAFANVVFTNVNNTDNNWSVIEWDASGGSIAAYAGVQYISHASSYADFVVGTRGSVGGFGEALRVTNTKRTGIRTNSPQRDLHVAGEVRVTDLDTDPATRIVGADADGDLDAVLLSDELAITSGTLGTNFSTTISPAQITAQQNDYAPTGISTAWILRISGDASFRAVTGITAPSFNKRLTVHNVGTNSLLLPNEHTSSSAANRFSFGRDIVLFAGKSIEIQYDVTSSRWRLLSKAGIYEDVEHLHFNERFSAAVSGTSGDYSFWEIVSENGIAAVPPVSGRLSGIAVNTGADVAGGGYVASKEQFVNLNTSSGTATWGYCKAVINTPTTLSNGTDNYVLRAGFLADALQSDLADGAYFYYNHSINSGAWSCYTQNGGTSQNNNSGVTVAANTVYLLEVYYHPNSTAVFFVNGTRVAENNSNLPSNDNMKAVVEIEKGGGTAQRDMNVYTLQTSAALVD